MVTHTTKLFEDLNSLFKSNNNFELKIAFQGFRLTNDNKNLLSELKAENKHTEEELRTYKIFLSAKQFNAYVQDTLRLIEDRINEKLDSLVENKIKCNYIIEKVNKLKDVATNIALMQGYEIDEVKTMKSFMETFPFFKSNLPTKAGLVSDDILDEVVNFAKHFCKMDETLMKKNELLSLNFIYYSTLYHALFNIKDLAENIIRNHYSIFNDDDYRIRNKGFPIIIEMQKIKRTDLKEGIGAINKKPKEKDKVENKIQVDSEPITLKMFFADKTKYDEIMALLVKEKFCDSETHFFIHNLKGWKGDMISLLKLLHIKGYYLNNIELTAFQISEIVKNTFGKSVSMSTIAQHKASFQYLQFIPVCKGK